MTQRCGLPTCVRLEDLRLGALSAGPRPSPPAPRLIVRRTEDLLLHSRATLDLPAARLAGVPWLRKASASEQPTGS